MRRRDATRCLWGSLAGIASGFAPFASLAQAPKPLKVGAVSQMPSPPVQHLAFQARMAELGYLQGQNFEFEFAYADGFAGYGDAYRQLIDSGVDILLVGGPEVGLKAALEVAGARPIVMVAIDFNPIEKGYVRSLTEPGERLTGLFFQQLELTQKRLQLLQEAVPGLTGATIFWDRISADQWQAAEPAAAEIGLPVYGVELRDEPYDFERALSEVPEQFRGALSVLASPIFHRPERRLLPEFALRNRLPSMYISRAYVEVGGLMAYGTSFVDLFRRAADFVDQIAQGVSPADLPIEQPTKFELAINLQTAKTLGITIPTSLLLRADEVIE